MFAARSGSFLLRLAGLVLSLTAIPSARRLGLRGATHYSGDQLIRARSARADLVRRACSFALQMPRKHPLYCASDAYKASALLCFRCPQASALLCFRCPQASAITRHVRCQLGQLPSSSREFSCFLSRLFQAPGAWASEGRLPSSCREFGFGWVTVPRLGRCGFASRKRKGPRVGGPCWVEMISPYFVA